MYLTQCDDSTAKDARIFLWNMPAVQAIAKEKNFSIEDKEVNRNRLFASSLHQRKRHQNNMNNENEVNPVNSAHLKMD